MNAEAGGYQHPMDKSLKGSHLKHFLIWSKAYLNFIRDGRSSTIMSKKNPYIVSLQGG